MDVLCRWLNLYLEAFALFWLLEHNYQFRWDHLWLRGVKYLLALASIALFRLDPTTTYFPLQTLDYIWVCSQELVFYSVFSCAATWPAKA